jgi:hypothetical protein
MSPRLRHRAECKGRAKGCHERLEFTLRPPATQSIERRQNEPAHSKGETWHCHVVLLQCGDPFRANHPAIGNHPDVLDASSYATLNHRGESPYVRSVAWFKGTKRKAGLAPARSIPSTHLVRCGRYSSSNRLAQRPKASPRSRQAGWANHQPRKG